MLVSSTNLNVFINGVNKTVIPQFRNCLNFLKCWTSFQSVFFGHR